MSRFDRNAALLHFLSLDLEAIDTAPLPLSADSREKERLQLDPQSTWVAIHPGTSADTPYKRYAAARYGEVARGLAAQGMRCIVTHGPSHAERALAEAVVEAADGAADLAPMTHSVSDLAVLLSRCALFVGSDSGPLHVASLVGTPVVQILGPTDPVENQPWRRTPSRSLRVPLACSPCRTGCESATCMTLVPPARVVRAALELVEPHTQPVRSAQRVEVSPAGFASPAGP